jgi:hypothetical protein
MTARRRRAVKLLVQRFVADPLNKPAFVLPVASAGDALIETIGQRTGRRRVRGNLWRGSPQTGTTHTLDDEPSERLRRLSRGNRSCALWLRASVTIGAAAPKNRMDLAPCHASCGARSLVRTR